MMPTPTASTTHTTTLPAFSTATATYGYPYPSPRLSSDPNRSGLGGNDPSRGPGGGGGGDGSPPPNPQNYPSFPSPAPRSGLPDSRYADCKKFAPTLDSLDQRRFLEFFLRRFDEMAIEYHLSEEQLLLVFGDRLVSSKIERAADWWMRLREDEVSLSWTEVKELFREEFIVQTLSKTYNNILEPYRRNNKSVRSFIWRMHDSHHDVGSDAAIVIQGVIEGCGDSAISNLLRLRRPRPRSAKECIRLLTDCDFDIDTCLDGTRATSGNNTPTASTPAPTRSPRQTSKSTSAADNVVLRSIEELRADLLGASSRQGTVNSASAQLASLSNAVAPVAMAPNTPVPPRIRLDPDETSGSMVRHVQVVTLMDTPFGSAGSPVTLVDPHTSTTTTRREIPSITETATTDRQAIRVRTLHPMQVQVHPSCPKPLRIQMPTPKQPPPDGTLAVLCVVKKATGGPIVLQILSLAVALIEQSTNPGNVF
ncbi:hypothetical protein LEN26_005325 [Aphanomyces euteiches]|nr:hypothetical protein AeMF1_016630 [Aphanomyces euteiches]KAH9138867.1 hypothetical protein LEN26_005325 [Aphanomyces euteiches]KAH9185096.1 hypothetical protein AeNC1_012926 [Aphanomyces euteiches]